jgi:hypothetical protein
MALFGLIKTDFERKKEELELQYLKDKNEQELDLKRRKKELFLRVDEKKAQLEEEILNYKIEEQRAKLEEALGDDEEELETGNAADNMLLQLGSKLLSTNSPQNSSVSAPIVTQNVEISKQTLTDEEIKALWDSLPADKKAIARIASDSQVKDYLNKNYPAIDDETIIRAIKLIKHKI